MRSVFQLLHAAGVDLILAGHEHHYERFAPMTPAGVLDTVSGMTQIVIGTGGAGLRGLRSPSAANSVARIQGHHGVLKLTLGAAAWRSAFIDVQGRVWDRSGGTCH
jgi:alkaline phosphatase